MELLLPGAKAPVRRRVPISDTTLQALRAEVSAQQARAVGLGQKRPNQEAAWLYLTTTTALGLSFYGWAVPVAINASSSAGVGLYLVISSASFFAPFFLLQNSDVTWGMTTMVYTGGTRGALHGYLLSTLLGTAPTNQSSLLLASGVGIAEATLGTVWAAGAGMSAGTAHTIESSSDVGMGLGFGLTVLAIGPTSNVTTAPRVYAGTALAGAAVGAVGGALWAHVRDYSWGDAEAIADAGLIAAGLGGSAVGWISSTASSRAISGVAMLTGLAGLAAADLLLRGGHLSASDGVLMDLGTGGGLLLTAGVLFLAQATGNPGAFATTEAIGAAIGWLGTYAMLRYSSFQRPAVGELGLHLDVNPMALVQNPISPASQAPPLVSLAGRF